ncbi:MAG: sigma-70 family RNA polymerase sigma factor [Stanieria sp.]
MVPRQSIIEIFSTFIQFDFDRFNHWATDPRLRRNMKRHLDQASSKEVSENFWAIYWHKLWQNEPTGLAREHLSAYLQEVCFWSTNKTMTGFTSSQYTISDCFQVAIAGIDKVLKGFNPKQGYNLKNYASITFSNLIRELLRQRQEVDICSDWALLRKLSQKRLEESLKNAGLAQDTIASYILAWNCLKTLYVPNQASPTRRLSKPDKQTWEQIVKLYQQESKVQLPKATEVVNAEILEKWLTACVKAARAYLYPTVTSINLPRSGEGSGEIIDNLPGQVDDSLLAEMIVEEEQADRNQQQSQINGVLIAALQKLDADEQKLLELYYARAMTQTEMAKELNTQQYNVSRKLSRARKALLKSLAQWSKETLHISLTSDVLNGISTLLEEWLAGHYSTYS